jgi:hypothetical protein
MKTKGRSQHEPVPSSYATEVHNDMISQYYSQHYSATRASGTMSLKMRKVQSYSAESESTSSIINNIPRKLSKQWDVTTTAVAQDTIKKREVNKTEEIQEMENYEK